MQVLDNGTIEAKPTSYSLIISNDDETGTLDLRIKVNRQTLQKFATVMPLLIPEARRTFDRLSFWLDVPVDINYYSKTEEFELGSKKIEFKVTGDDMVCWVPGYHRGIGIKVSQFVEMVNDLYKTIEGRYFDPINERMASGDTPDGVKTFRALGVKIPNAYLPNVVAAYDKSTCVISYYGFFPATKQYNRGTNSLSKYFIHDDENGWVMINHVPFMNRTMCDAVAAFRVY